MLCAIALELKQKGFKPLDSGPFCVFHLYNVESTDHHVIFQDVCSISVNLLFFPRIILPNLLHKRTDIRYIGTGRIFLLQSGAALRRIEYRESQHYHRHVTVPGRGLDVDICRQMVVMMMMI